MDQSSYSVKAPRTSGIPRLSKLPLPRTRKPSTIETPVVDEDSTTPSSVNVSSSQQSTIHGGTSNLTSSELQSHLESNGPDVALQKQPATSGTDGEEDLRPKTVRNSHRRPRPSLSDRTVETLSQIPPSPSPARRKSGFFSAESPMRPPARPELTTNTSRPNSRTGPHLPTASTAPRPSSPYKRPVTSTARDQSGLSTPNRRSVSSFVSRSTPSGVKDPGPVFQSTPSRLQEPNPSTSTSITAVRQNKARQPLTGNKTFSARSSMKRPPVQNAFQRPPSQGGFEAKETTHSSSTKVTPRLPTNAKESVPVEPQGIARTSQTTTSGNKAVTPENFLELRRPSTSSSALRESIAKAKAAQRRTAKNSLSSANVPRALGGDHVTDHTCEVDPSTFDILDSGSRNVLRKRVHMARTDGRLNIAALGLTKIPDEVMKMYDSDAVDEGKVAWYECVDLTRLIAADNELAEIEDKAFPDITGSARDYRDDSRGNIFGGLELLDLHGNLLRSVPAGLRSLQRLTTLNLTRNKISMEALTIISDIRSLRELRLGENSLHGELNEDIAHLSSLQILDLHGNALTSLRGGVGKLSDLRIIDVAGNKLSSLPIEFLALESLVEINVSRNRLSGVLTFSPIVKLAKLQTLDVSSNALLSLTEGDLLELPMIQTINISNNRFKNLPDVTGWTQLSNLVANDNQIASIPDSFYSLHSLRTADLSGNSLVGLDDRIGLMEKLSILRVDRNPLRERRVLSMNTEELKLELRSHLLPESVISNADGGFVGSIGTLASETARQSITWPVTSGTLDRSNTKLDTINPSDLEIIATSNEVKNLLLHHNILKHIPTSIELLGTLLTTLDLSNNKLGQGNEYLADSLNLPCLQSLNLASNTLTTLSPLVSYFSAPKLTTLILSFNRLTAIPRLRATFPILSTLLMSSNKLTDIDVEAVRGLRVFDVSGNDIGTLPPTLGLLQGELKTLIVQGNKFRVPGWGVLEKGTEELLSWLKKRIPVDELGDEVDSID
ncbi:hypothetical protein MMC24_004377 [Lignoscripta atroalba]|nr:hypothetical protein [Lignoscripta atroalba]